MKPCLMLALMLVIAQDKPADDSKSLKGEWQVVSMSFNGKESSKETVGKLKIEFSDKEFTSYKDGREGNKVTFKLDPSKKPKQIDLTRENIKDPALGLYELKDDRLTLCYGEPGAARPKDLTSKGGDRRYLIVLKRVKK